MYRAPTIFLAQLLVAIQVLMTLHVPLSTTMALPVTSKPIESTVENLAWQAWIALPPEQKQRVKSRKVTPKSIFTLPLRVECPEGHKPVDTKCIPIVIGSNAVLIDLNALGLVVGNTQTDEVYDYDDIGEELANPKPYGGIMQMGEAEKSVAGVTVEIQPPFKDEPLKFNIFENKFNIFEEAVEDYSSLSNEGDVLSYEKEKENVTVTTPQSVSEILNVTTTLVTLNDLANEASNISENNFGVVVSKNPSTINEKSSTYPTLAEGEDFKMEAISLPVSSYEAQKDSSIQLLTTVIDAETIASTDDSDKQHESDIKALLQTESLLPLVHQAISTTLQNSGPAGNFSSISSLTTISLPTEQNVSSADSISLNVDDELTTLSTVMESELAGKEKQEYTRSVTTNPLLRDDGIDSDDNDQINDTTLETEMIDEPVEATTPIQLDETTVIEISSSLSTTPSTLDLKELLLQREQALKNFEELQRMRKDSKDKYAVLKKSKVEPVEVLSTTVATATTTNTKSLPTEIKTVDELIYAASEVKAAAETVTPLLTVHNENDSKNNSNGNNNWFYYKHFVKQDIEEAQQLLTAITTAAARVTGDTDSTTKASEIETMPFTSEIDLVEELRLINELVRNMRPATTTLKTMQMSTTTTEKPKTTLNTEINLSLPPVHLSESYSSATKPTLSTQQIWSKIMPFLTTTTTTTTTTSSASTSSKYESSTESTTLNLAEIPNDMQTIQTSKSSASGSSYDNRSSKIIRINGFNTINVEKSPPVSTNTTEPTSSISFTITTSNNSSKIVESSTENNTHEPYWSLPVTWRLDKPATSIGKQNQDNQEVKTEKQPLLLRFWSTYHASKSS